jgi:hypothetical protein
VKIVTNCEKLLFQRPDDAIIPGYDKQTESTCPARTFFVQLGTPGEPEAEVLAEDAITFEQFTAPVQNLFRRFLGGTAGLHIVVFGAAPAGGRKTVQEPPLSYRNVRT